MRHGRKRWLRAFAAATALALVAAACGGDDGADDDEPADEAPADDDAADDGDDGDDGDAPEAGEGGSLTVLHAQTGEVDTAGLRAAFEQFSEETGIAVEESGSSDFEQLAITRVQGGNPPDIILHPQPGLMYDLIDQGLAFPQNDNMDVEQLREDMIDGLVELGERDGNFYGLMVRLSIKSLVWYDPVGFEENGYEIPETWEAMVELSDQMVADGNTPWCIGIESSDASGWVFTDWLEDVMLRLHGGEVYDQWIANEVKFDSPEVRQAIEEYIDPIFFTEGYVFGGTPNILQTSFGDSPLGLFDGTCMMHRQASFIEGFFPDDAVVGENVDFFYLPEIAASDAGAPALIAGDIAAAYTDNPAVAEFFNYFATPESGEPWAAEGAWLSSFKDFNTDAYADESLTQQGELLVGADFARFDASDMMPGAVGAGSFWTEAVNYIQRGGEDVDTMLANIDASWP